MTADALIYPARINALNGEPGGGKTWVALHACVEAMNDGHHVMFIDLEDHPGSTVARLQALGCANDIILERFHYKRPGAPMTIESWARLERQIAKQSIALVVIDSIGELMSLQGIRSSNDDDEVAKIYRLIPRRIADLGPAVLLLDHVPKGQGDGPQMWAIGSQRKKAAIDGAAYMVETSKAFSADTPGRIILRTAKDRNGNFVVGSLAAEIEVSPSEGGGRLALDVRAPQMSSGALRQTSNMRKVSEFLEGQTDASANRSQIKAGAGVRPEHLSTVLEQLRSEGWVSHYSGGVGKADRYALIHPFSELATPPNAVVEDDF